MSHFKLTRILPLLAILLGITAAGLAQGTDSFHKKVRQAYQRTHSGSGNPADLDLCMACHVEAFQGSLPDSTASQGSYPVYASPTLDAGACSPGAASLQCLGCHDGAIADSIVSTGAHNIRLDRSHPVGMTYDTALADQDKGLHDPDTTPSGLGGSISQDMLFDGRVECISCHNPHGAEETLMKKSNRMSALCLTCHNK